MDLRRAVTLSLAVVALVVGGLLALVGGFLVPKKVGPLSVGAALALLAVGPYVHVVGRAARSALVGAVPALGWLGVTMFLASLRTEGDLVVTGSADGLAFLLLGTVSSAVGIGTVKWGIQRGDRKAAARELRRAAAAAEAEQADEQAAAAGDENGDEDAVR